MNISEKKRAIIYTVTIGYLLLTLFFLLYNFSLSPEKVPNTLLGIPTDMIAHLVIFIPIPFIIEIFLKWHSIRFSFWGLFTISMCVGITYGSLTEGLQTLLITGRKGNIYDLLADSLGTLSGFILNIFIGTTIEKWLLKITKYGKYER